MQCSVIFWYRFRSKRKRGVCLCVWAYISVGIITISRKGYAIQTSSSHKLRKCHYFFFFFNSPMLLLHFIQHPDFQKLVLPFVWSFMANTSREIERHLITLIRRSERISSCHGKVHLIVDPHSSDDKHTLFFFLITSKAFVFFTIIAIF